MGTGAVSSQGATKIIEDRALLQMQRLDRGQNALCEATARGAVISKAAFAPEHGRSDHSFGVVVGGLDTFNRGESPQRAVDFQQAPAEALGFFVRTLAAALERLMETVAYRFQPRLQGSAVDSPVLKIFPDRKDFFCRPAARFAQGLGRSTLVDQFLKIALQMRPANLPLVKGQVGVGTPAVGADNAANLSQQRLQSVLPPFGVDLENHKGYGRRHPQPTQLASLGPNRFHRRF